MHFIRRVINFEKIRLNPRYFIKYHFFAISLFFNDPSKCSNVPYANITFHFHDILKLCDNGKGRYPLPSITNSINFSSTREPSSFLILRTFHAKVSFRTSVNYRDENHGDIISREKERERERQQFTISIFDFSREKDVRVDKEGQRYSRKEYHSLSRLRLPALQREE